MTHTFRTLADLPFYVAARFTKTAHLRRCEGDGLVDYSSQDILERTRAISLGLQALGVRPGDHDGSSSVGIVPVVPQAAPSRYADHPDP